MPEKKTETETQEGLWKPGPWSKFTASIRYAEGRLGCCLSKACFSVDFLGRKAMLFEIGPVRMTLAVSASLSFTSEDVQALSVGLRITADKFAALEGLDAHVEGE